MLPAPPFRRRGLAALAGLGLLPRPARAWAPEGPVRLLVGTVPGGATDLAARMLAEAARGRLAQPVVVENLSGAGGNIAAAAAARARPDGRTFLLGFGALVINHLRRDPPGAVDPLLDLLPVARVMTSPAVVLVRRDAGVAEMATLAARLRAPGAAAAWAPPTPGTILHLVARQMLDRLRITEAEMIPYRGAAAMQADFIAGRLSFVCDNPTVHMAALQEGSTRALAVLAGQRSALLPAVPAASEMGLAGIDGTSWWGLFAPPGTDPAAVEAMAGLSAAMLASPEASARLAALGLEPAALGARPFAAYLSDQQQRWAPAISALPPA